MNKDYFRPSHHWNQLQCTLSVLSFAWQILDTGLCASNLDILKCRIGR